MTFDDLQLENDIKALAEKHGKPYVYCSQLVRQEMREGTPVTDALEWLDRFLPNVKVRVR